MGRLFDEAPQYPGPGESAAHPPPYPKESQNERQQQNGKAPMAPFQTNFACLSLNMEDRIRLIDFPNPEVTAVVETVKQNWEKGVQNFEPYGGADEIKLGGYAWGANVTGRDPARILMLRILERLFNMGWVLQLSIDAIRKESDKDTLIFRKQDPIPRPCHWLCVSFDRWDKLKIVGGPPQDLSEAVVAAYGDQLRESEITAERVKMHFKKNVWTPSGVQTVETRRKLLVLVSTLERFGYSTYAGLDIHNGSEGRETDILIVNRQEGWSPGLPIWHR